MAVPSSVIVMIYGPLILQQIYNEKIIFNVVFRMMNFSVINGNSLMVL